MTREEAIEIEAAFVRRESKTLGTDDRVDEDTIQALAAVSVDRLIAFGLLKLDKPKSLAERIKDAMRWSNNSYSVSMAMLNDAGLKIVEK